MTIEKTIEKPQPLSGARPTDGRTALRFFRDLEPFFARKHLTYVDVGAHRGDVFRGLLQTELKVREAHLIEPNPRSFRMLTESVAALDGTPPVCHHLALAAAPGRLRLRDADTMTRVIGAAPTEEAAPDGPEAEATGATFEIPATTLDELARGFGRPKISILKIDVEGYELEVFGGARQLLADQAIDVIYIEAGMNPEGRQQTYYRAIEDRLREQGYRLFRIYEQKHEWLDDSPLLRRANLAFMSESFASRHPYQLSRDLMLARREVERLTAALSAGQDELTRNRARILQLETQLGEQTAAAAGLGTELKAARGALEARAEAEHAQEAELSRLRDYGRELEKRYQLVLASSTWRAMEPVRRTMRLLTGKEPPPRFQPKLGGTVEKTGSLSMKDLFPANPQRTGEYLIQLAGKRDFVALAAREKFFASERQSDQNFFLGRFSRLLGLKRLSAFSEAARVSDEIAARLGKKHAWIIKFFGEPVYARFVVDATTALTRVGRYEDARRLVDDAIARLDRSPVLLQQRAEVCWPYAPDQALEDLADCRRRGALDEARLLLQAYLETLADTPVPLDGRLAEHPQMPLVATAAALRQGDFATYRTHLNGYFEAQGLRAPLPQEATRFAFPELARNREVRRDGPLVSVVMTTCNSEDTVDYAVASLLQQTHGNLEIFIVDDCSTDGTRAQLQDMQAADDRIRVLFNEENVGTYCSKNRAIERATGAYVTLHDSDDWAHPERIARHVEMMERSGSLVASRSEWLRLETDGKLHFRRWGCKFQHPNPASTFFRREILNQVGFFDSVRYGADSEHWFRLNRVFGTSRVKTLPLCLGLGHMRSDSLTRSGSGVMDQENYSPVRGAYAASYLQWQATAATAELRLPAKAGTRRFWAPPEMTVGQAGAPAGDPAGPVAAPAAAGVPEFMFGISFASKRVSVDWERTQELLGHTLRSLLNQSDPRFSVVICGHERPKLRELDDPRIRFVESDRPPPKDPSGFRGDKMRKRRIIGAILRQRGGGYFFPLDADDLVHRDVVAHVLRDDNRRGYLIDSGYTLDYNNRTLAPVPGAWSVSFDRSCGSSAAIFFEPEDLPLNGELDNGLYFNLFQSHAYWPLVAEEFGRRLEPLPFPAGVYVLNHAQNLSFRLQRKGVRTENIVRAIAEHRIADAPAVLAEQFGLGA